jgi:5-methylcytosine-specific restriction protein A
MPKRPAIFRPHPPKPRQRENRPTAAQRGYSSRWQRAAKIFLAAHPLCVECKGRGLVKAAECVDHITPHRGDQTLFWDSTNWQPLCKRCHDSKTARGE